MDSRARVLNSVKNANVDGIPVIEVKDIDASLKNRSVKETLTILGALPESMRKSITKVTAETQDSVTTTLNDGDRVIIWGDSSQLKLKLAEVEEIDKNITAGTAGFAGKHQIDVSSSQAHHQVTAISLASLVPGRCSLLAICASSAIGCMLKSPAEKPEA